MTRQIDSGLQVERLIKVGLALSSQRDLNVLLEMIIDLSRDFTGADGGTLYIVRPEQNDLTFEVVQNDTLGIRTGGTSEGRVALPPVPLSVESQPNISNVSAYVANTGRIVNIPDVYRAEGFDFTGTRRWDAQTGYRCKSMLVVPMEDHEKEIIGVLQLINALHPETREVIPFSPDYVDLAASLASMAAVAVTNVRLIRNLEDLFDAFIQTIASGMEEKSRYTGGHIRRVTDLTIAIARNLNETRTGPLARVNMTAEELNELRIAAWMHDVGKITTPEYIVDKARKLETIFDRIELIRTRFELAQREAETEAFRAKAVLASAREAGDGRAAEIDLGAEARVRKLREDLEFLTQCNTGGEFMEDGKISRLKEIAGQTVTVGGKAIPLLSEEEVYNLSIRKGTLTPEEFGIMRNHASVSIKMLSQLPFTRKLRRVPEYAGGHHEALNGKGYPQGLRAEQLPLQARIMAIADVFEALTAHDRPYKRPMPLSVALKIIGSMVQEGHLDPDIVEMCVNEGVFLAYARKELNPDQMDLA